MALTKSAQTPQSSASNSAGGTTTGSWLAIGYGVSGVAKVTNAALGPTVGCDFVLEVAQDGSGTNVQELSRQTASNANSAVSNFPFAVGVGGNHGDWSHYRTKFTGNTGQAVTVEAQAMTVTAL